MSRPQYPTGDDLSSYLQQAGFSTTFLAGYDLELFALAGWEAFNRAANRTMLAVTGTRSLDPASPATGVLIFEEDLASGVTPTVTLSGTALTVGTDVRFEPLRAAGQGIPYQWARFLRRWPLPLLNTIAPPCAITGSWGYATSIPEDAWVGMLAMAAVQMGPLIAQARTGGMQMWREADMEESYGPKPLEHLLAGWSMAAVATCGGIGPDGNYRMGRYTRVTVG